MVTNSLPIASLLASRAGARRPPRRRPGPRPGRWRPSTTQALAYLRSVSVDVAFIGTNGFSVGRGLTTPDSAEAAVKSALIASARRRVLLADHTKYGSDHFAQFAGLAQIDTIVTDRALPNSAVAEIEAAGPQVVRA